MILNLNEEVQKQARRVKKQAEKLYALLNGNASSADYDTNAVLIRMDKTENELTALRDLINREKEQAYIDKLQGNAPRKTTNALESPERKPEKTAEKLRKSEEKQKKSGKKTKKAGEKQKKGKDK